MFFEKGKNDSVVHRGPQDTDNLIAFVYVQIGKIPKAVKVSNLTTCFSSTNVS